MMEQPDSRPAGAGSARSLSVRLFTAGLAAAELMTVYLGLELGLYRALGADRPTRPSELAERAGIAPRYAREWLEQQAAGGIVLVENAASAGDERRYRLPAGHCEALTDADSPFAITPLVVLPIRGLATVLPRLAAAYRTGEGVPYAEYGRALRGAQGGLNRSVFRHFLPGWIARALPDVHHALAAGGALVADVACGSGWSSIALAGAYPGVRVDGLDLDPESVADARRNAADAGLAERVRFDVRDAADAGLAGRYQLVCLFDALHDMSRPVEVLRACRSLLAPGGTLLVMEPAVGDRFAAPAPDPERFQYAVSVLHCLPVGMSEQPSAATGTVIRPETVRAYAAEAGLRVRVLPGRHPFHRLYRLSPDPA
jgi:SAM-dependent methyltransferase